MARPPVPDYTRYFNPVLQALRALGGSASIEELNARVGQEMKLSEDVLAVPHDPERGGQSEVAYRIAWARTYLKVGGLITNSERGVWSLTPEGIKTTHVDEKALAREVKLKRRGTRPREDQDPDEMSEAGSDASPAGHRDWQHEALDVLHDLPATAFERLCQRVLRESGFVEVTVTGRSGDSGIDGVGLLRLQDVITFHVIFQCKRWRHPVDPATVRDFRGAMVGRTDKGLIMTTSYFTREALREATRDGAPPIDLIDGEQLVALLKKLRLGVRTEMVERVTVERRWFEEL
ncbi:MAG TPA: restriction endonuclease [Anaeromyxobacter sp.]|nr:restriction endonuclease [Anaeromyxobacter sp.]